MADGVEPAALKKVLREGLATSGALEAWDTFGARWKGMLEPAAPGAPPPNLRKDQHLALDLARALGFLCTSGRRPRSSPTADMRQDAAIRGCERAYDGRMASTLIAAGMTLILSTQLTCTQVCDESVGVAPAMPPAAADGQVLPPGHPIYKGLVGNLLEGVPMDAERRVELQRASTAISAPFTGRSIALLLGLGNPVLFMAGGAIWGIWSASRIAPDPAEPGRAMTLTEQIPGGPHSALISD